MSRTTRLFVSALIMLCPIVIAHAALPARGSGAPTAPVGLTSQGRLLWNLEAQLKVTFGRKQPLCVSGWNFTSGDCTPLAKYLLYWYPFQAPHGTVFHIVHRKVRPPSFGNYPVAIRIRGHLVACDARERHFLIDFGSGAGLMLGCLAPQPE